jgi:hypothetical protein
MQIYYVKSHFHGWREVSKERFDSFVEHLRKNATGIPADKKEAYIQTRTRIKET